MTLLVAEIVVALIMSHDFHCVTSMANYRALIYNELGNGALSGNYTLIYLAFPFVYAQDKLISDLAWWLSLLMR